MKIIPNSVLLNTPINSSIEQTKPATTSFSQWVGNQISKSNEQLNAADNALNALASGQSEQLHQTMITLEEAKISFQYLQQIRNRLMSAYQELMREQI